MNQSKRIGELKSGGRLRTLLVGLTISCTAAAGQQKPSILGVVHKVGGLPVSHVEVRIEGAGASETSDSGEFALAMTANLKVGMPAVFHVSGWVILKPCELKSGRTYLRDPTAEPIEFLVLAPSDPRIKSAKANVSIIGCLLEEEASEFAPKPKTAAGPRSALPRNQNPVLPGHAQTTYTGADLKPVAVPPRYYLVEAAYRPSALHDPPLPPAEKPTNAADATRDGFLAQKARELGLSVAELKSAISAWSESVQDSYEKGLAALHDLRYAEASQYILASIPSPPGALIDRYVPLARAEYEQGHYAVAESALRKVLDVHPDDPLVLNNLALALAEQAKYSEAEPLYKRALAINETALGPGDPKLATELNNLASLYGIQGKYNAAEPLFQRALAINEKALGANHPAVARDLNNLALLYYHQGKYSDAEPLYKRALAILEQAFGPDHSDVAGTLNNLGNLYAVQAKYSKAEPLFQRALAIKAKELGPDHPSVARSLDNLASVYGHEGKYGEAEPLYQQALAINEKALGANHPAVAIDLNNLGWLYAEQGRYSEADPLYRRALAINEKALGPNHPSVATTAENLAITLRKLGRNSEAEVYEQQAARIRAKGKQ